MPPVGFEPTISAGERPKTYALDRVATGTGSYHSLYCDNNSEREGISVCYYINCVGRKVKTFLRNTTLVVCIVLC